MNTLGGIILAAGKGRRMRMNSQNKVTVSLADKPMVQHIVDFMHKIRIDTIVVVVGFAKQSVINILQGQQVIFAEQKKRLGTGHAVLCALKKLPGYVTDVFVVYGDDAVLYTEKNVPLINKLFDLHYQKDSMLTFLTIEQENPFGLGRILRDKNGKVTAIIEEKDAIGKQRNINEINPGCFVFSVSFLREYLPKIEKSSATGEYYLTSLIDLAIKHQETVETLRGGRISWRGVNTHEELLKAEELYKSTHT